MKNNWIVQGSIVVGFLMIGSGITQIFQIPLPGSVMGMILLFLFLLAGFIKLDWVEDFTSFQLKHLTILFIPPIVNLFFSSNFISVLQWHLFLIMLVSSICCLLGSAIAVELYERRKRRCSK
ncbi:holin-like protein [Salinibacillus kushneri]|uniref:Holin-like protein n=1 Tax=Salinibacillus kushneri TaxID=237682 RepID=A0A1I0DQ74_9BACI|nr:CidA/LrgA family protein [Salinibacillus kushneri]SET34551.1 holin-like protein [Salinibacillus kushneri]